MSWSMEALMPYKIDIPVKQTQSRQTQKIYGGRVFLSSPCSASTSVVPW